MLRIIYGKAGSGKTAFITAEIKQHVEAGSGKVIMLVPEQYSHEAERELCRVCGDSLSLYGEVLSFSRLAACVEEELGVRCRLLDNGAPPDFLRRLFPHSYAPAVPVENRKGGGK